MIESVYYKRFLIFLLLIFIIISLISSLFYIQLYGDGGYWAFDILNNGFWHVEHQFFRYSTLVIQTPAVLFSNIFHNSLLTISVFCISYGMFPILTLLFLYKRLREKNIFYVYLMIFFTCIIPSWVFAVSVSNESICIFMLLTYYLGLERKRIVPILLLCIILLFSYESGFLFFILLAIIELFKTKKSYVLISFLSLCFIILLSFLFFKIVPSNAHVHFNESIINAFRNPYFYYGVISIFTIAGTFVLSKRKMSSFIYIFFSLLSLYMVFYVYKSGTNILLGNTYDNRIWGIPLACLVYIVGYYLFIIKKYVVNYRQFFILILIVTSYLAFQTKLTFKHVQFYNRMRTLVTEHPGCYVLSEEQMKWLQSDYFVPTWSLGFISLIYNKSMKPTAMFTSLQYDHGHNIIPNNFCELKNDHFEVIDNWATYRIPTNGYINLDIFKK